MNHLFIVHTLFPINRTNHFFLANKLIYFTTKFITAYESIEAIRDEIVAASTAEYSNFNSCIIRRNLVTLLTISNIELANSILIKIRLNAGKLISPVSRFVYFRLLSI